MLYIILGLIILILFFGKCRKKEVINSDKPVIEVCKFGDLTFDKRLPQEDVVVQSIAKERKGRGKPVKPTLNQSVIFIDFDGHVVTGTNWNYMPEINCSPSGLSLADQLAILEQVKIDYDLFNVIVTSDESVFLAANPNKRIRCIVTESYEWYGQAGGVAYINSFTWGNDTPCFVFSSLLSYNVKRIHEAISHEVGHTLGLYHQARYDENCIKLSDYNTGCCGEAPIMGVAYYQPVGKWWVGPNSQGCTNIQDDVAKIKTVIGLK